MELRGCPQNEKGANGTFSDTNKPNYFITLTSQNIVWSKYFLFCCSGLACLLLSDTSFSD